MCTVLLTSVCFFVLRDREDCFVRVSVWPCMLALFLRYNYTRHVKLIARILFLFLWYFCGISRTVIWKFPLILFLLNFACFKFHDCKGKIKYLQEYSIITSQTRFLFIFRNSSVTDCYTRYPIKSKKSWCSAPK